MMTKGLTKTIQRAMNRFCDMVVSPNKSTNLRQQTYTGMAESDWPKSRHSPMMLSPHFLTSTAFSLCALLPLPLLCLAPWVYNATQTHTARSPRSVPARKRRSDLCPQTSSTSLTNLVFVDHLPSVRLAHHPRSTD